MGVDWKQRCEHLCCMLPAKSWDTKRERNAAVGSLCLQMLCVLSTISVTWQRLDGAWQETWQGSNFQWAGSTIFVVSDSWLLQLLHVLNSFHMPLMKIHDLVSLIEGNHSFSGVFSNSFPGVFWKFDRGGNKCDAMVLTQHHTQVDRGGNKNVLWWCQCNTIFNSRLTMVPA